jgi:hypothetical protein
MLDDLQHLDGIEVADRQQVRHARARRVGEEPHHRMIDKRA